MTEGSLNDSMGSALKHYRSMFFLPSFKKALMANALIALLLVGFSTFVLYPTAQGFALSLVLGLCLFGLTFVADLIINKKILKEDPIFLLRRTVGLSLFCWGVWIIFILIGVGFGFFLGLIWWVKFCLLGYAAVITLRCVVLMATSSAVVWRRLASALLQPSLCMVVFVIFWATISSVNAFQLLLFLLFSTIVGCVSVFLLLYSIDRLGRKTTGVQSMVLFRAFMLNWVVGLNEPLERILNDLGEDSDIEVSLLKFDASNPKAAIIVPLVHPGPFKNIGSSLLPSILKRDFENELGYVTSVPLGILGHELDLTSQAQNHKIIEQVVASARFVSTTDAATPFVKVTEGVATVSCQIFGTTALLSFTLAPKTTEDLPQELGQYVAEEARKIGIKNVIVVNAHNSLNDIVDTDQSLEALRVSAFKCLQKTVNLQPRPFRIGAATVFPREFNLKDGMGGGGITVLFVQVENQKTVYVVIDGNNMVPHLREEVISDLSLDGFDESEIFTTDTHAVSAVVTGRRGYHPVGEVMDRKVLINYIKQAANMAVANAEGSKAGFLRLLISQVRVIGEARLKSLSTLVDEAIRKAKQMVIPIFGLEALLLVLLLLLV